MKLRTSLLIVLGMFSAGLWAAVWVGWTSARESARAIDAFVALSDRQLQPLHNTERALLLALSRMDSAYIQLLHDDQVQSNDYARQASASVKAARQAFAAYVRAASADSDGASSELMRAFDAYVKVLGAREEALYDVSMEDYARAAQAAEEADRQFESRLHDAIQRSEGRQEAWRVESDRRYAVARNLAVGLVMLSLLLTGFYWYLFERVLLRPLREAGQHFDRIASGDLGQPIEGMADNEIGVLLAALQRMQSSLMLTVRTILRASEDVEAGVQHISQGNVDLSRRTEIQAAALQRTASTLEQLASAVKGNVANTRDANDLAAQATGEAMRGRELVDEVVVTMTKVAAASENIGSFVGLIDQIAFQTNLLALNAAVEATHAGPAGAGFAVVATEVRSLALRCADAARQIRGLIEQSSGNIELGSRQVTQAGQAMQRILGSAERVRDTMREIAHATAEQSAGIDDASMIMVEMEATTKQNARLVEQTANAAATLSGQAEDLVRSVGVFRISAPLTAATSGNGIGAIDFRPGAHRGQGTARDSDIALTSAGSEERRLSPGAGGLEQ